MWPCIGLSRTMARRSGAAEASTGSTTSMVEFRPLAPVALASRVSRPDPRPPLTSAFIASSGLASALRAPVSEAVMSPDRLDPLPCRLTRASTLPTKSGSSAFRSTPCSVLVRAAPAEVSWPSRSSRPPPSSSLSLAVRSWPASRSEMGSKVWNSTWRKRPEPFSEACTTPPACW